MRQVHIVDSASMPDDLNVIGETVKVMGAGDDSKPFEVHLQVGVRNGGPPPHSHPWDEAFYIIEGEVQVSLDNESKTLSSGEFIHIPAGTVHAYRNISETAKMLAIVSDVKGGKFFADTSEKVHKMPEDFPILVDVARSYGLVFHL